MKKYNDSTHDFEYRILGNDAFLKWAKKAGFEPRAIDAPMLYQMYSKYLESVKATAKAAKASVSKPKAIKPGSVKHTREIRPDNNNKFNKR